MIVKLLLFSPSQDRLSPQQKKPLCVQKELVQMLWSLIREISGGQVVGADKF